MADWAPGTILERDRLPFISTDYPVILCSIRDVCFVCDKRKDIGPFIDGHQVQVYDLG